MYEDDYDFYDTSDDEIINEDDNDALDDYTIESAAAADGEQEKYLSMADYSNYGASINLDNLTNEQRELYDNTYHSSKNS